MKRYSKIPVLQTTSRKRYRTNPIYPDIPLSADDFYVITTAGDRYDNLAATFYKDSSLWWIIASANNSQKASLFVKPGIQIRIPGDIEQAKRLYESINS